MLGVLGSTWCDDDYNRRYYIDSAPAVIEAFHNKINEDPTAVQLLAAMIKQKGSEIRARAQEKATELMVLKQIYDNQIK